MLQHLSKDLKRGIFRCFKDYYLNFAFGQHKLGSFEKTINWLSNEDEFSAEYSTDIMALSGRSVRVAFSFFPLFEAPETSIDQSSWQVRQIERNFVDNPHRLNRNRQAIYAGIRRLVITDELSDEVIFDYHRGVNNEECSQFHISQILVDSLRTFVDQNNADDDIHTICRCRVPSVYHRFRYDSGKLEITTKQYIKSDWGTRAFAGIESCDDVAQFAELVCSEALCAGEDIINASFIEIDRSNLQRIYLYENQGTSFNSNLESYLQLPDYIPIDNPSSGNAYRKGTFINTWLKKLLNARLVFEPAPEGIGIYIYLVKTIKHRKIKVSIADVGYGITPLIAMLVRIEFQICQYVSLSGSAYGRYNSATLFIEEPESNLHPNFQSLLADIFVDAVSNYPIRFVFETHSEYFVRKFQVLVASKKLMSNQISINYLYDPDPHRRPDNEPQVKHICIKENGGLTARFGTGFFDESTRLSTELFK